MSESTAAERAYARWYFEKNPSATRALGSALRGVVQSIRNMEPRLRELLQEELAKDLAKEAEAGPMTPPMTRACIAAIFNCHRNQVKAKVLDKYRHEPESPKPNQKIRMLVKDMGSGWEAVVQKHARPKQKKKS